MKLTKEQQIQVEQIMSGMECSNDFKCYRSNFTDVCEAKTSGELIECKKGGTQFCQFAMPFGFAYYCKCPLNKYIYKELSPVQSQRKVKDSV